MLASPEFWVAVSFVLFVALMIYLKVPGALGKALDNRAAEIKRELDEARRLREEAQAILADYQRKQREAEKEAADIVAMARQEAQFHANESRQKFQETLARRMKAAEDKIGRAEAQAVAEVRARSVDAAIAVAERIIQQKLDGPAVEKLVSKSINEVKTRLQ